MSITTSIDRITPVQAMAILELAGKNRAISRTVVKRYAASMEQGDWCLNGEAIIIDDTGYLLDGQHRLHAVIESGCTIEALVVRGVDRDAFPTVDIGLKRSASSVFAMDGHSNTTALAAGLRLLHSWLSQGNLDTSHRAASPTELRRVLDEHPDMTLSATAAAKYRRTNMLATSAVAFTHYMFMRASDEATANEFFRMVSEGDMLALGDPCLTVRNRLIRDGALGSARRSSTKAQIEILIRAWNAKREGRTLTRVIATGNIPAAV